MMKKISEPEKRPDAAAKTGGYACYIDDMEFKDAIFASTLRSDRPRAVIKSIEIPDLPDGYYIVDKDDVPGINRVKMLVDDQPFFAEDRVNYIGEPILLVAGPDRAKIETILSMINVRYADLKPVLSIDETAEAGKEPIYGKDNCFASYEIKKGDIEKAFEDAKEVLECEYRRHD